MPINTTKRINNVHRSLLERIEGGLFRPGDRFLSVRAVAEQFEISYQTAHRLIGKLCDDGLLERRPRSGTYVAGSRPTLVGVQLIFGSRARRPNSFGNKLLTLLSDRLDAVGIDWSLRWPKADGSPTLARDRLPIVWEANRAIENCVRENRNAILFNDRVPIGLGAVHIDSVSTDDFTGGALAAHILIDYTQAQSGLAVLAGPADDPRSQARVAGFCSLTKSAVIHAGRWYQQDGYAKGAAMFRDRRRGIFCCNDALASGLLQWCREQNIQPPPLVGFDDAPIAQSLNLTTISLRWEEMVEQVVQLAKRRLAGNQSAAVRQIFSPVPVMRGFGRAWA